MSTSPKTGSELVDVLAEKDEMIQVLTGRLEEIAEQYDRLQRMGNTRAAVGSGGGGGGSTTETLNQKLDDILGLFPETHPGDQLQRIEDRIESMMKMLESAPRAIGGASSDSASVKKSTAPQTPSASKPAAAPAPPPAGKKESGEDFWEAAKARLMGGAAPASEPAAPTPASSGLSSASLMSSSAPADESPRAAVVEVLDEVPPPAAIGPDASAADLIAGLDARDRYITYMISRARHAETAHLPDWDSLAETPAELRTALGEAQAKLDKHLRESEISISLERAALARERSKLFQIKQQLEKQIMRLGKGQAVEAAPEVKPEVTPEAQADQRWLRMFSSGKKKES